MNSYPVLGQHYIFDIGIARIEQSYPATDKMHYKVLTGSRAGQEETVAIGVKQIAENVFLVSWQESDKTTVVHVEDFNTHSFHSVVTMPDGAFHRITGAMWPVQSC